MIKQYMKAKPIRYSIKILALACYEMKYIYNLEVYLGKSELGVDGR